MEQNLEDLAWSTVIAGFSQMIQQSNALRTNKRLAYSSCLWRK